jgi:hypothetical protein
VGCCAPALSGVCLPATYLTPFTFQRHATPCTLHRTPCTLHPTPYTFNPTPYTLQAATKRQIARFLSKLPCECLFAHPILSEPIRAYRGTSPIRNRPTPRTSIGPQAWSCCRVLGMLCFSCARYPCIWANLSLSEPAHPVDHKRTSP